MPALQLAYTAAVRCLFCKARSDRSRSCEHIVPESFGNTEHVLPPGVVCDSCNNYLARKVEKPLLDSAYFRHLRLGARVPNKRGRSAEVAGVHMASRSLVAFARDFDSDSISVRALHERDEPRLMQTMRQQVSGRFYVPVPHLPHEFVARFVAKVGLEALALRMLRIPGALDELIDKPELNQVRNFVRWRIEPWDYTTRYLYGPTSVFTDGNTLFTVDHEFCFLTTKDSELFFILALFGEEFSVNLGGPSVQGYRDWLQENGDGSPLYPTRPPQIEFDH